MLYIYIYKYGIFDSAPFADSIYFNATIRFRLCAAQLRDPRAEVNAASSGGAEASKQATTSCENAESDWRVKLKRCIEFESSRRI